MRGIYTLRGTRNPLGISLGTEGNLPRRNQCDKGNGEKGGTGVTG